MKPTYKILSGFKAFTVAITRGSRIEKKPIKAFVYSYVSDRPFVRVGYTALKGTKRAVVRNRMKRLMRESFSINKNHFLNTIDSTRSFDIVFMYFGNMEDSPGNIRFREVSEAITSICSSIVKVRKSGQ